MSALTSSEPPTAPIPLSESADTDAAIQSTPVRSRVRAWLTTERPIPSWVLICIVLATCTISGAPIVASNVTLVAEGAPTAYLALIPVWVLTIAMAADRGPRRHDVSDSDVDRILAGLIAVLAIGSCQLVLRRLGAVGEFWHVHLVAVIAWVAALSILKFGTRAAARTRVAWFYLFVCFPPIFLLTGQALGGSLLAYGALTALYGAVAMFLALRQQDIRWVVAPIYFGLAFAGTYLLRNGVVPLAYLLPNAVLTLLTITLFVRAPRERGRADIPRHSLLTVAVVIALSALVGLAPKQPVTHTPRSDLMWVRADWVNGLHNAGIAVGPPDVFAWVHR